MKGEREIGSEQMKGEKRRDSRRKVRHCIRARDRR